MEMSQGNNLYSYHKQIKMSFFSFFYKIGEHKSRTGAAWRRLVPVRRGRMWGNGAGG
jgi:hypothetical protein